MSELETAVYVQLLEEIKARVRQAQIRATLSANSEMIVLYWDIGRMIDERQRLEGWGAAVIPRLARDLRNELPEVKGFSERNLKRMAQFFREYPDLATNGPRVVAQMELPGSCIPCFGISSIHGRNVRIRAAAANQCPR